MSIRLVVWDWNGTLFDDTATIVEAMNLSDMPMFNLEPITVQQYQELYEVPIAIFFEKVGVSRETLESVAAIRSEKFLREYERLAVDAALRTGALEVVEAFQKRGVHQIILSNHTVEGIYQQLARLGLTDYLETVLANDIHEHVNKQGKSHRLHKYLDSHEIEPREVLIVGDTIEEARIAKELGLTSVVITGGCCSKTRLREASPDHLIDSLDEIINIVEEIV